MLLMVFCWVVICVLLLLFWPLKSHLMLCIMSPLSSSDLIIDNLRLCLKKDTMFPVCLQKKKKKKNWTVQFIQCEAESQVLQFTALYLDL